MFFYTHVDIKVLTLMFISVGCTLEPVRSDGYLKYYTMPRKVNPCDKTVIYRGTFQNKMMVFIRRTEKTEETKKKIRRDIEALQQPSSLPDDFDLASAHGVFNRPSLHENFIRYVFHEENEGYVFVATEWCICSVEDLYNNQGQNTFANKSRKNWAGDTIEADEIIRRTLGPKQILRQATEGLAYLHELGYVHRNLEPSNFLIAQIHNFGGDQFRYVVKLSDFRLSKNWSKEMEESRPKGLTSWFAPIPEHITKTTDFSADVFILGCFYFYVLTYGLHPFGQDTDEREQRINNQSDIVYTDWKPDEVIVKKEQHAIAMIKEMIKYNPEERWSIKQILDHTYFLPENYYHLYNIPGVSPGLCVIFDQEIFVLKKDERTGTEHDMKMLSSTFRILGFDVRIYRNLKGRNLDNMIQKLAKENFSSYASLTICILSHGMQDAVLGTDNVKIDINDLKYNFNSSDCPSLHGKPKIWIIQACQGERLLTPMVNQKSTEVLPRYFGGSVIISPSETTPTTTTNIDYPSRPINPKKERNHPQQHFTDRPRIMDFLDIRASIPGHVSIRFPKKGSVMIQYLCEELRAEYLSSKPTAKLDHLDNILMKVQKRMNIEVASLKERKTNEVKYTQQTIYWSKSLSDSIRFQKAEIPGNLLEYIDRSNEPWEFI